MDKDNKSTELNNTDKKLHISDVSKRFWLYRPRNGNLFENIDEETMNNIINEDGGIWNVFDHEPSHLELQKAIYDYLL